MNDAMANAWKEDRRIGQLFGFIRGSIGGGSVAEDGGLVGFWIVEGKSLD